MARPVRRSVGSVQSSPTPSKVPPNSSNENSRTNDTNNTVLLDTASTTVSTIPYSNYSNSNSNTTTGRSTSNNTQFNGNASSSIGSGTDILLNEINAREKIRNEFYATYDVMTGVRIAATLAGFFGLMVFLIVYKSRSHSSHPLKAMKKNPNLAAQAAIVMQVEEQREFEEAWHATSKFFGIEDGSLPNLGYKRERINSLGNISAPPALHRGFRFSSFAGYSSLLEPPRRFSYSGHRRKSTSESSRIFSAYQMGESFGEDDFIGESGDEEDDDEFDQGTTTADIGYHHYLNVPGMGHDSRRSSDITCCSTESSYLERRCSAITLGLAPLPSISSRNPSRRPSSNTPDVCELFPNIQVIQPTPKCSPFPSEGNLYDKLKIGLTNRKMYDQTDSFDDYISEYTDDLYCQTSNNNFRNTKSKRNSYNNSTYNNNNNKIDDISSVTIDSCTTSNMPQRRAPLASLSSFKISSADFQDSDLKSLGSDSVFAESYADTDEDMEQFSTDSDEISDHNSQKTCHTVEQVCINIEDVDAPPVDHIINNDSNIKIIGNLTSNNSSSCDLSVINKPKTNNSTINLIKKHKSNSVDLINQFETKAIIERQNINDTKVVQQRPASYAGCSSTTIDVTTTPDTSKLLPCTTSRDNNLAQINTNIEPNDVDDDGDGDDDDDDDDDDDYDDNTKSSECFDVDCKNVDNNHSVILELPVIKTNQTNLQKPSSKTNLDDVIELDPSIPGPSRKWSRETLF